ncbi:MAG: DUF2249 domain-containing protein [Betaproteobacteria bacterium]|nr:DUF2249 domain-containing protein [Betaproteobacteria bacterium]MDH5223093.1 DUF2249 domain-containing protein [Betaproteobacteria bacterium]MDH5350138.1 DUF2249 domain-containing protein [Betaproteobacteria bacterium]
MAPSAQALIDAARDAAVGGDWAAFRRSFAALRESCAPRIARDEDLRQQFDMLGAAAPQYDPQGCLAAFESLVETLGEVELQAPGAALVRTLELRGLQPPEPIVRILEALEREPDEPLRAILPHEPAPLYALLQERGFTWHGEAREDGGYELLIERA